MEYPSVIEALQRAVPGANARAVPSPDMEVIQVERESIAGVCRFLRDDPAFRFALLIDVLGVDLLPEEPRFQIVYLLVSLGPMFEPGAGAQPRRLRIITRIPGDDPSTETVTGVWPSAGWPEREIFDLFGITFRNHPDLRRILMTDDWEGHPLRKDYPVQIRKSGHIPWAIDLTPEQFAKNVENARKKAAHAAGKTE